MKEEYRKKHKKSNHITLEERIEIDKGIALGKSIRQIASELKTFGIQRFCRNKERQIFPCAQRLLTIVNGLAILKLIP